jgi:hypothetical protein
MIRKHLLNWTLPLADLTGSSALLAPAFAVLGGSDPSKRLERGVSKFS